MGRIAFVFSGQGDQYPGMGKNLVEKYPTAAKIFEMCDSIRPGTSKMCFEGTEDKLKQTANTQPCLFALELAAASVLAEKGVKPEAAAGFSLGEVTAVTFAGIFDSETGFKLVCKRGELMQRESEKFDAAMAAVVKLTPEQVIDVCKNYSDIYPVNFNCPGQVSVSGAAESMPSFFADVKAAGGKAIPLKVRGAFHSPMMKDAAKDFETELKSVKMGKPTLTVYSDMTASPYTDDVVNLLSNQICSPVQWERAVRNMIASGIDTFVEIGPGKTLCNMIRKIDAEVKTYSTEEYLAEVEA